jgi:hypothetical protein
MMTRSKKAELFLADMGDALKTKIGMADMVINQEIRIQLIK